MAISDLELEPHPAIVVADDTDRFADGVSTLLRDEARWTEASRAARTHAAARFPHAEAVYELLAAARG